MKPATAARMSGLLALSVFASPLAMAADSGWYVGGNVGLSKAKIDDDRIANGLLGSGLVVTSISDDERDTGYKLYGGYQFNRYFSLEGGYFDLGKFGFTATTIPAGTLAGSIKVRGLNLDAVGTLPITERFAAFGRVGVNYAQVRDSFSGTGAVNVIDSNPRKRRADYKVGVGVQYAFTEAFLVRAEAERYRIDDAVGNKGDVDLFSVGLVYRFGDKTPTPAPRAVVPAPVAVAPAPLPPPPPPPPPPRSPTRITLSADSLFDFDKATIKPSATQSLEKLASDLKGTSFDRVAVTGHTDRLGPHAYNMKLSTSRAEAVKAWLVRAGVPASQVTTSGVDGANPVTKPGECVGTRPTRQLIACLQPDRRVEVEVSGTR